MPGQTRRRIWRVTLENPLTGGPRSATFHECEVVRVLDDGEKMTERTDDIFMEYDNPAEVLALVNPLDDSVIGQTTLAAVLTHIHSLARHAQYKRDNLKEAEGAVPP
jgi:hypothetical protein